MEKLIISNIKEGYNIYEYIDGTEVKSSRDIDNCLEQIYKLIKKYKNSSKNGFGYIYDLKNTWKEFLESEIEQKAAYIRNDGTEMRNIVHKKLEILGKYKFDKKLIHGDLGGFNLICKNHDIVGIIDPRVIIGDPLYDYIFFVFSSYNICSNLELTKVIDVLSNEPREKIIAMMYIILFDRISIEEKHNTQSKKKFYKIWNQLKKIN